MVQLFHWNYLALRLLSYLLISRCGATSIAKVQSDCYGRQVVSQLIFNSFLKRPRFPHSDRKTDKPLYVMIIICTQKRLKHCNIGIQTIKQFKETSSSFSTVKLILGTAFDAIFHCFYELASSPIHLCHILAVSVSK